ncbi:MAG: hypothetical protein HZB15_09920 [Actinobacteria bacterium]|nr:hypothetical protein [Actinomycetota bacterium]
MIISPTISTSTDPYLHDLTHLIAAHGIAAYESDVARFVVRQRSLGHDGSLTDLLADRDASAIARERAFGTLVGQLARGPARTLHLVGTAA